ncbi:MAG: hypothetical protein R3C53_20455 [Pirellulaceae bacterium]
MRIPKLSALAILLVFSLVSTAALAECGQRCCCMCGKKVCVLKVSEEKEDVIGFEVESKEICIPGIKFPWNCKRNCGGVRHVCVLKEEKKEKTVCKYDWSIKTVCTTCCRRHGLKHHQASINLPQVNHDERLSFEFYAADALPEPTTDSTQYATANQPEISQTGQNADLDQAVPPFALSNHRTIVPMSNMTLEPSREPVGQVSQASDDSPVRSASATLLKNIFRR